MGNSYTYKGDICRKKPSRSGKAEGSIKIKLLNNK